MSAPSRCWRDPTAERGRRYRGESERRRLHRSRRHSVRACPPLEDEERRMREAMKII